jgi:hypothetical protein
MYFISISDFEKQLALRSTISVAFPKDLTSTKQYKYALWKLTSELDFPISKLKLLEEGGSITVTGFPFVSNGKLSLNFKVKRNSQIH